MNKLIEEQKDRKNYQEQDGMIQSITILEQVVLRIYLWNVEFNWKMIVEKRLSVSELPVTHQHHQYWRFLQNVEGFIIELVIKEWWLLEVIRHHKSFENIDINYSKKRDWKQNWICNSMNEWKATEIE